MSVVPAWMLGREIATIAEDRIRVAVSQFGIDGHDLELEMLRWEENGVWKLTSPTGESWLARLVVVTRWTPTALRAEIQWLHELSDTGLAPSPLRARNGDFIVTVELPGQSHPAGLVVLDWIGGTVAADNSHGTSAEAIGETTARLHAHPSTTNLAGFETERPTWDAEAILYHGYNRTSPQAPRLLGPDGMTIVQRVAERIVPILTETERRERGRVHGDLHHGNIIATPGGKAVLIDFDDCGTGYLGYDIATVFRSTRHHHPEDYDTFTAGFITGYTRIRPLPAGFTEAMGAYLVLRQVFALNYLISAIPYSAAIAEHGPARITEILTDMTTFIDTGTYPGAIE